MLYTESFILLYQQPASGCIPRQGWLSSRTLRDFFVAAFCKIFSEQ
jgi:hypothetical protein